MPPLIQSASEAREHAIRVAMEAGLQNSPLLSLPLEILRKVLAFALPTTYVDETGENTWQLGSTSVLRVCQQLHTEGVQILYANPFNLVLDPQENPEFLHIRFENRFFSSRRSCGYCSMAGDERRNGCKNCRRRGWNILMKEVPMENVGEANLARMRHWIIEIVGWGECFERVLRLHPTTLDPTQELEVVKQFQDFVTSVIRGPLHHIRAIKKVTVKWVGRCPGTERKQQWYRSWILLPFEMHRVAIEEDLSIAYGGW